MTGNPDTPDTSAGDQSRPSQDRMEPSSKLAPLNATLIVKDGAPAGIDAAENNEQQASDREARRRRRKLKRDTVPESVSEIPESMGRYEIRKVLGAGAFGCVYLGFDAVLNRLVAIKVPRLENSSTAKGTFLAEARQLAQLRHPGIVGVFDVGIDEEHCYIVSDYLNGPTLDQWLLTQRPAWQEVTRISAEIAESLSHAHAARTIHRDLKPTNIIMVDSVRPVIVDFGLAVSDQTSGNALGDAQCPPAEFAERGAIVGTPHYMSPEQTRGEGHRIDGRTDIYSLGVILYAMLTGRKPFPARDLRELFLQIQNDEPQPPRQLVPTLPRALEQVVLKAMAKSLSERYLTAMDMALDLRTVLQAGLSDAQQRGVWLNSAVVSSATSDIPAGLRGSVLKSSSDPTLNEPRFVAASPEVIPSDNSGVKSAGGTSDPGATFEPVSSGVSSIRRIREAERRRVTVLDFSCDVFTSDIIQQVLSPEEQRDLLIQFQELCRSVVIDFGGMIVRKRPANSILFVCTAFAFEFSSFSDDPAVLGV